MKTSRRPRYPACSLGRSLLPGVLLALAAARPLPAVTLVKDGQSEYVIVVKPDAPQTTQYAARELQIYIRKVAQAELPIATAKEPGRKALFVGSHSALPADGDFDPARYSGLERFRIAELSDGDLVIMGADCDRNPVSRDYGDFGLLFGVYDFLEKFLGVRWYAPGEFGETFEPRTTVEIDKLPIDEKPYCWSRYFWPYVWNEFSSQDALIFNRRLRGFGVRDGGANHSMMDLYFLYKDTRPEIFALEPDGKSRRFGSFAPGTRPEERKWANYPQYCFTNPDTLKAYCDFIDAVYENRPEGKLWVARPPTAETITIVPDDNYTSQPCHCENCQKLIHPQAGTGSMTPLVWGFVKQVAEFAKAKYPGKKVMALAYEGYYKPPDFDLPDNVVVQICVNPYIIYHGAPLYRQAFDETLRDWSRKTGEISLWHYWLPYDDIPYSMPHILYQWFRDYPSLKAVFLELNDTHLRAPNLPRNPEHSGVTASDLAQSHLNLYFAMRGTWGSELDVDRELDTYYRLFYGPAAAPMKTFHETAIQRWEKVENISDSRSTGYAKFSGKELYEKIYTPAAIAAMTSSLAEAKQLAPDGSLYRKRLDWLSASYFDAFLKSARAFANEVNVSRDTALLPTPPAPTLDGQLDDPFWLDKPENPFVRIDAPLPPRFPTMFKLGFADGTLFLGIRAQDPDSGSLKLDRTAHDSDSYSDDSIELLFCPNPDDVKSFSGIVINLNEVTLDYTLSARSGMDRSFESGVTSKTVKGDGFYTMEIAIPLDRLGIDMKNPAAFRLNVCRNKWSGVGENHEYSAWFCPSGSFMQLADTPIIRLIGTKDPKLVDFRKPVSIEQWIQTMPGDQLGPTTRTGCRLTREAGIVTAEYTFNAGNHRYDYGNLNLSQPLAGADLREAPYLELRFRNPDADLHHTVTYAFKTADGETAADYIRFCTHESHPDWRVRAINMATDGYQAGLRRKKGLPDWKPVELTYVAVYSHCAKMDGQPRAIRLDYIRVTGEPLTSSGPTR